MRLAIDPGIDTGWAEFEKDGTLTDCGLGDFLRYGAESAVIELPQVYRAAHSKGDPNDLITLAVRVGRYAERLESAGVPVSLILPRTWKGTIDKLVVCRRIIKDLTPSEAALVATKCARVPESKINNVIDAIGLGKWATRLRKWP